jgi:hypothetical protein
MSVLLLVFPFALTANAQTTRTYVANSGNDGNQCTASAPCQTITKALSVVDAGGEVIITENGDYDKFFTNKSVTVTAAPGVNAGIVSNANNAIFAVLTSTDSLTLRNLNLKAVGDLTNSIGIYNSHAGTLNIDGCSITGFETGVLTTNGPGQVFIHDTVVRNNVFGISLIGPQTEGLLRVVIDHCRLEANDTGVAVGAKVIATIENSVIANHTSRGIHVRSTFANLRAEALVDNCQISNNTLGLVASTTNGGFSVVRLTRSTINSNVLNGVQIGANSTVYSLQNNTIAGNLVDVNGGQLTPLQVK